MMDIRPTSEQALEYIWFGRQCLDLARRSGRPGAKAIQDGRLLVHPTLSGEDLKEKARPIYDILQQATPEGMWVEYSWKGKDKRTFIKRYQGRFIVASGY